MALVTYSIPNLVNGISQQADALRRETQGDLMDNGWASVVDGLQKRPPIETVAKLTTDIDLSSSYVHAINRDTEERYIVIFGSDEIRVFGVDGTQYIVASPDGLGYLPTDPSTQLRVVTVDDYSFAVNTQATMAMSGVTPTLGNPKALVEVRAANYSSEYRITIDGTEVSYTTTAAVPDNETSNIATELYDALVAEAITNFSYTVNGNTILIENTNGDDFVLDVSDDAADTALVAVKDEVNTFTDLPSRAEHGFTARVVSDAQTGSSAYWVEFERPDGDTALGTGSWVESVDPSLDNTLDPETMPHVLVRYFDDASGTVTGTAYQAYFSFEEFTWDDRTVGDELSSPAPSFVGTTARDIFFWRDRLGILTPSDVILTEAGYYGNFWRTTVTALKDSAPIDLAISDNQVANMVWAVPDEQDLILFSDQTQYILSSPDLLTPSSASIRATTRYEASRTVRPVLVGDRVYFPQQTGGYVGLREYYVDSDTQKRQADEITGHVNRYLAGSAKDLTGSAQSRVLISSTTGSQYVYVYQWFTANQQKLQSAWHRWDLGLGGSLLGLRFIDTTLYFVSQRSDGVYLEKVETDPGRTDDDSGILIYLDRRVDLDDAVKYYDAAEDQTVITLPQPCDNVEVVVSGPPDIPDGPEGGDPDFEDTYYHIQRCDYPTYEPPVYVQDDEFSVDDVFLRNGVCYKVNSTTEADPELTSILRSSEVADYADCATCLDADGPETTAPPLPASSYLKMARCEDDSTGEYTMPEQIMGIDVVEDLTKIYELDNVCYYVTNDRTNSPTDPLFPTWAATVHDTCIECLDPCGEANDPQGTDCSVTGATADTGNNTDYTVKGTGTAGGANFWSWTETGGTGRQIFIYANCSSPAGASIGCGVTLALGEVAVRADFRSPSLNQYTKKTTAFSFNATTGDWSGEDSFTSDDHCAGSALSEIEDIVVTIE